MSFELENYKRRAARPLADAIVDGDLEKIKEVFATLGFRADQFCNTSKYHTDAVHPLFLAMLCNQMKIFIYLVEEKHATIDMVIPGVNGMEGNDMTLLHFACLDASKLQFVEYLLEKGAKVNAEDKFGWTPLHCAALKGHKDIVTQLILKGADVKAMDADGEEPLDKAMRGGHHLLLSLLGWRGGDPSTYMMKLTSVDTYTLKIAVLGAGGVGKTSLVQRFLKNKEVAAGTFPTMGAVRSKKSVQLGSLHYDMTILDLGGHERYDNLAPVYYRGCSVVIVTFDLTNRASFYRARDWVTEVHSALPPQVVVVLVGNKIDLRDEIQVTTVEARAFATNFSLLYVETSAITGRCVYELFVYSLKIYRQIVGRFAKTSTAPIMTKRNSRVIRSCQCDVFDLRTGKQLTHKHDKQVHFLSFFLQLFLLLE